MADALLDFVEYKDRVVKLTFAHFPAGSVIMLVNKTSGEMVPHSEMFPKTESGKLEIRFPPEVPPGEYYVRGLDRVHKKIVETVYFYVAV
jgi:hypothetical protein